MTKCVSHHRLLKHLTKPRHSVMLSSRRVLKH
ncbi:hypothetical protein ANCCEY_15505 [Ancylostoma ceylanicum]|uniref:Uncharacterized protein n=1 Tax=Ancylostoma ceylanicum TaxID=53326 RepID=A0A0D6L7B6_9BILA|nr:hypothetical protein ANCCEY_15505 [Ancylostoma ceylanicum]